MRPVCVECGKEMECTKNGFLVVHFYEKPKGAPESSIITGPINNPVTVKVINIDYAISPDHFDCGRIDFIVKGDKYSCPTCEKEIVTGYGEPIYDYDWTQEKLQDFVAKNPGVVIKRT